MRFDEPRAPAGSTVRMRHHGLDQWPRLGRKVDRLGSGAERLRLGQLCRTIDVIGHTALLAWVFCAQTIAINEIFVEQPSKGVEYRN